MSKIEVFFQKIRFKLRHLVSVIVKKNILMRLICEYNTLCQEHMTVKTIICKIVITVYKANIFDNAISNDDIHVKTSTSLVSQFIFFYEKIYQ